jgi:HK97 family phage prohead protease
MHQKHFKLEVKSVEDDGTFTGYASVTGNLDSDNEVIDKGAFKRTLDHTKGVVPILWQHDRTQPVGWNVEASEDGFGLAVKGRLMVDTELGRYAQSFLKTGLSVGAKPGLSIGFTVPKGTDYVKAGVRHFKEVALKEYSIATFQSNLAAAVSSAKQKKRSR